MRKTVSLFAAAALAAGIALFGAGGPAAAAAASQIVFYNTQYDAPGTDTRTNAHLNLEWISIINNGTAGVQLRGWTIRDKANHVFTFGTTTIPAKTRLLVHTGRGTPVPNHRYYNSGNYIWNNTGDTAYLRNAAGTPMDSCSWGSVSGRSVAPC
jgi:hypothetical protein